VPNIYIICGPNGAGKTTAAQFLLPKELKVEQYINADHIAHAISPFKPEDANIQAGKVMIERIKNLISRAEDFAFETTLSTKFFSKLLKNAKKEQKYKIHLIYIWVHPVSLAKQRVAARVKLGGHGIEEKIIERRYYRSINNFFKLYKKFADEFTILDNSNEKPDLIADKTKVYNEDMMELFKMESTNAK